MSESDPESRKEWPSGNRATKDDRQTDKSSDDKGTEDHGTAKTSQTAGQYAQAVNCWMQQCYYWHLMAANFPYFAMQQMMSQQQQQLRAHQFLQTPPQPEVANPAAAHNATYVQQLMQRISSVVNQRLERVRLAQRFGNLQPNLAIIRLAQLQGREFRIPSAWKRFSAELVDFAILFLLKLFITFIAMDFFDMIDLDKRYEETYFKDGFHFNFTLQLTQDIFILELIHRVVVCFFEALCLHQGTNGTGGATPGKSLLGLRVVTCESIQLLHGNTVLVYPAGDIGLGWALLRSVVKNFTMALLFPACITMFFFPFQRTVYDILCGCLVVEDIRPPPVH